MKKIAINILFVLMVIGLSSCKTSGFPGAKYQGPQPGEAPPEVVRGWGDGCETGISVYGNSLYKTFYTFKMDKRMVNNKRYYRAWKDALDFCRHWMNEHLREGLLGRSFSNDLRDDRTAAQGGEVMPGFMGW